MTVKQIAVPFQSNGGGVPVIDDETNTSTQVYLASQRSSGQSAVVTANINPQINSDITVQSLGITLGLGIYMPNIQPFGKMGKVLGGILQSNDPRNGTNGANLPLGDAPNPNMTMTLWDPASDPLPPSIPSRINFTDTSFDELLLVSQTLQFPTPIKITPGNFITAGLFSLPMLIGTTNPANIIQPFSLCAFNAAATFTYDDGI